MAHSLNKVVSFAFGWDCLNFTRKHMEFKKIVLGAFGYIFQYKKELAKALFVPFVIYVALDFSVLIRPNPFGAFFIGVLSIGIQTIFAITTHRMVLLGPASVPNWGVYTWSKRETFFALHLIGLAIILIPIGFLSLIPTIGIVIAVALICWLLGRLSLVFPAIAIDQGVSFKYSWELTKNRNILMFLVVIIFPILLTLPAFALSYLPYTTLLSSIVSTFATIFVVSSLSVAYKVIYSDVHES